MTNLNINPASPSSPKSDSSLSRTHDCTGCRYVDAHGLVCGACLRKILDDQAEQSEASLLAACFDGHNVTLLRSKRVASS